MASQTGGCFIAGMGIAGSGKSTIFAALNDVLIQEGKEVLLKREPEEPQWPAAVMERESFGYVTALTWFRSQRVPGLFQAASFRDSGGIALVDSYYDKLIHLYFDEPGFEWLMKRDDPYRSAYRELIAVDYTNLPDADCVVDVVVKAERWRELVRGRGRELDRAANLLATYETRIAFSRAVQSYCADRGIPCISFENNQSTALAAAVALREQLKVASVLS